jgi:hypothetical protein
MNTVRLKACATLATLALACEGGTAPTPRQVPELDLGSSAPIQPSLTTEKLHQKFARRGLAARFPQYKCNLCSK